MTSSAIVLLVALGSGATGQTISQAEVKKQSEIYKRYWGENFEWRFDKLPTKGRVPDYRVPYSGCIYPDVNGGTVYALSKYDRAFRRGRRSAAAHERWDTTAFREPQTVHRGGFGFFRRGGGSYTVWRTPHWYGHCNGWTSASIRHAEPQRSVRRNGVTFHPSDIKALLAEIYIYNKSQMLASAGNTGYSLNPALFHVIVTNWLGRNAHPIGMEGTPGKEKWNYPIYAYKSSYSRRGNRVSVRLTLTHAKDVRREYDKAPRYARSRWFNYELRLDSEGKIVGGYHYRNSSRIDMLWMPKAPVQGGTPGNKRGNPYVDVNEVLALWRASVPEETREKWLVAAPRPVVKYPERIFVDDHSAPAPPWSNEEATVDNSAPRPETAPAAVSGNTTPAAESAEDAVSDDSAPRPPLGD